MNDPLASGIGENTYKTVEEFNATYFKPLNVTDDPYDGEYLAICEPPEGELDKPLILHKQQNRLNEVQSFMLGMLQASVYL